MELISMFIGEYRWLSNFHEADIEYLGRNFPTNEHAYQAAKCKNPEDIERFKDISAGQARRLGQRIEIVDDWNDKKFNIMYEINWAKFIKHRYLAKMLVDTGNNYLMEGNWWHDNYWGVCTCHECKDIVKHNSLGKILMNIRERLWVSNEVL